MSGRPRWRRWLVDPLLAQLRQGVSPQALALTLAIGGTLGIMPILGISTVLCGVLAVWLRLNQPAIQLVNYLAYPLQLAVMFPYYRAGEWLYGTDPVPLVSLTELVARFQADVGQFFLDYGAVGLYGLTVWALTAPVVGLALYAIALPLLRGLAARYTATSSDVRSIAP